MSWSPTTFRGHHLAESKHGTLLVVHVLTLNIVFDRLDIFKSHLCIARPILQYRDVRKVFRGLQHTHRERNLIYLTDYGNIIDSVIVLRYSVFMETSVCFSTLDLMEFIVENECLDTFVQRYHFHMLVSDFGELRRWTRLFCRIVHGYPLNFLEMTSQCHYDLFFVGK